MLSRHTSTCPNCTERDLIFATSLLLLGYVSGFLCMQSMHGNLSFYLPADLSFIFVSTALLQLLVFADVELVHLLVLPQPNSLIDSHEVHCLFARIKAFNFVAGLQSRMDTWYYVLQVALQPLSCNLSRK